MTTLDELFIHAPPRLCFHVASDVERWPDILPHYRWVRYRDATASPRIVEMAAWRDFAGPLRYPTWWLSEMRTDDDEPAVRYRHIGGVTKGMDVKWSFQPEAGGTKVQITHSWNGPPWPLIGRFAWEHVIADHFVSFIASRTLRGVAAEAERQHRLTDAP